MNNILLTVLLNTIFSPSFVIVMAVYSGYANVAAAEVWRQSVAAGEDDRQRRRAMDYH
jgi:hypothetical protein